MFEVGRALAEGDGVAPDIEAAVHWWRRSAGRGETRAMRAIERAYVEGTGVERNADAARHWRELAHWTERMRCEGAGR